MKKNQVFVWPFLVAITGLAIGFAVSSISWSANAKDSVSTVTSKIDHTPPKLLPAVEPGRGNVEIQITNVAIDGVIWYDASRKCATVYMNSRSP